MSTTNEAMTDVITDLRAAASIGRALTVSEVDEIAQRLAPGTVPVKFERMLALSRALGSPREVSACEGDTLNDALVRLAAERLASGAEAVAWAELATNIVRAACESDPADPSFRECIYIEPDVLREIVLAQLESAAPPAPPARAADDRRRAPWCDFAGNPIHAGDVIRHTEGDRAVVFFDASNAEPWRVIYLSGEGAGALRLQIGDKGQAVVENPTTTPARAEVEVTVCCGRPECGGECGNEWRGTMLIPAPVPAVDDATRRDAERYRAFFDSGLPITFLGFDYYDKSALDSAIDTAMSQPASEVKS